MDLDEEYEVIDKRELEEAEAPPASEDVAKPIQNVTKVGEPFRPRLIQYQVDYTQCKFKQPRTLALSW